MADERPNSKEFDEKVRKEVGLAIKRAREGAGHPWRPSFVNLAGKPLGLRSLLKLESGQPVGAAVYEAAGRTLGLFYEDWDRDTPYAMFKGAPEPRGILKGAATQRAVENSPPDNGDSDRESSYGDVSEQDPADEAAPNPADYADLEDYFRATIKHLMAQGLPRDAVLRAAQEVAERESMRRKSAEGNSPTTSGNGGSTSG